ncbi:MAG: nucleotide-binding protein [Halieaceae bacterium]|nr:nucleotide-binding protein [Halieaceae bacterium]
MTRPAKAEAIERLQKILNEIPELKELRFDSPEFKRWEMFAREATEKTFGRNSNQFRDFQSIHYHPEYSWDTTDSHRQAAHEKGLRSAEAVFESMIDVIEEYWEEDGNSPDISITTNNIAQNLNKVFVIHGQDESAREAVARFLEKLELEPVILHELPNKGRTIIEKFEDYADVKFAVVLLTPDDAGKPAGNGNGLEARARQNVIFELGFFIGKLGRERVCALLKDGVEIPSDYDGVVYIKLDTAGGWKMKVIQELKAASFDVDANRAL